MANEILKNDNSITLDWNDITGATAYHIQVSKTYWDFRATLLVDDNTLVASTHSFTSTGNGKYYWRYKAKVGGTWGAWRECNMFIVNVALAADLAATAWAFVNKSDVSDYYLLENQPLNKVEIGIHYWEAQRRNRKGDLRSEHYTTKAKITLGMNWSFLGDNQKAETERFYNLHTSFYLIVRYDNQIGTDYVYRIYEVMFTNPPSLDAAGSLEFEEV